MVLKSWGDIWSLHFFFRIFASRTKKHNTMIEITLNSPISVTFEGVLCNRIVFVTEINVLKSGKASFVRNKEGEKFNYEFLDDESKEIVDKIVEFNKKYL